MGEYDNLWTMPEREEEEKVARLALIAAMSALKDMDAEQSDKRLVKQILSAFLAVKSTVEQAEKALRDRGVERWTIDVDEPAVVASALHYHALMSHPLSVLDRPIDPNGLNPYTIGGRRTLAFANACLILEHSSLARDAQACDFYLPIKPELVDQFEVDDEDEDEDEENT